MGNNRSEGRTVKKKVITTVTLVMLFMAGLTVMLYPTVADYINSQNQSRVIEQFFAELVQISEADYSEFYEAAQSYNESLLTRTSRFSKSETEVDDYHNKFDFTGTSVIGTLEIDLINVKLPIYLGTRESVLQIGIGHLEGSSFPIGGTGTHSVISGHRGLPSSTLLTNADRLMEGDVFALNIMNETLYYEIDHRVIVDPDNFEYLAIDPDKDYCTIFTCTPYGINSHRLMIRGFRIFPEIIEGQAIFASRVLRADANRVSPVAEYVVAAVPIVLLVSIFNGLKYIKSRRKGRVIA